MSRYIATRAIRGANALVMEADLMLQKAIKRKRSRNTSRISEHSLFYPFD
jgi:hypothetical protein